jgi:hypothetical protein
MSKKQLTEQEVRDAYITKTKLQREVDRAEAYRRWDALGKTTIKKDEYLTAQMEDIKRERTGKSGWDAIEDRIEQSRLKNKARIKERADSITPEQKDLKKQLAEERLLARVDAEEKRVLNLEEKEVIALERHQRLNEYHEKWYTGDKSWRVEYEKKRQKRRLIGSLRSRAHFAFSNKGYKKTSRTAELLGATFETVREHLELLFYGGMSWENHGSFWHVDHIYPISMAEDEDHLIGLLHHLNLQPLLAHENLSKSATPPEEWVITNKLN